MHKSRNRKVSRPSLPVPPGPKPPFLLPPGAGQGFPADLIVPPHRGAVITSTTWDVPIPAAREPLRRPRPAPEEVAPPQAKPVQVEPPSGTFVPLPAARAPALRRQGFIDIVAFVLRDSGRKLARWSNARRKSQDTKARLVHAEARLRAMEAQLEALQALQGKVR
jgi:hypothetical protein